MADAAIYLLPGMKAKISIPDFYIGHGERELTRSDGTPLKRTLSNGFWLEDEVTGTLEPVDNEPAVVYTHKKFAQNRIVFFGRNPGEECTVSVISVPIHDHSSIVTGGPAFGSYFSDDETQINT